MLRVAFGSAIGRGDAQRFRRWASSAAAVQEQLLDALEGSRYITESADQAFLEAEPAERGPKEAYVMRYQDFARKDLDGALTKWEEHLDRTDPEESQRLRKDAEVMKTVAHAMLARDNLMAAVRESEQRMKRKEEGNLKGMHLEHCQ